MRLNLLVIVLQFVHLKPAQNLQKPQKTMHMVRNHISQLAHLFQLLKSVFIPF